jgi:hypothetical protein
MKKTLSTLLLACSFLLNCFAHADNIPTNLNINIDFKLAQQNEHLHTTILTIKQHLMMHTAKSQWTIIQNQHPSTSTNRFILLGKIDKANAKSVQMSFLVADAGKTPAIIANPEVKINYGQKGKIVLQNQNKQLALEVLARA